MEAGLKAEELEGKARSDMQEENEAESSSSNTAEHDFEHDDATEQSGPSREADELIKRINKMSRQPTVEDDDSNWGLNSNLDGKRATDSSTSFKSSPDRVQKRVLHPVAGRTAIRSSNAVEEAATKRGNLRETSSRSKQNRDSRSYTASDSDGLVSLPKSVAKIRDQKRLTQKNPDWAHISALQDTRRKDDPSYTMQKNMFMKSTPYEKYARRSGWDSPLSKNLLRHQDAKVISSRAAHDARKATISKDRSHSRFHNSRYTYSNSTGSGGSRRTRSMSTQYGRYDGERNATTRDRFPIESLYHSRERDHSSTMGQQSFTTTASESESSAPLKARNTQKKRGARRTGRSTLYNSAVSSGFSDLNDATDNSSQLADKTSEDSEDDEDDEDESEHGWELNKEDYQLQHSPKRQSSQHYRMRRYTPIAASNDEHSRNVAKRDPNLVSTAGSKSRQHAHLPDPASHTLENPYPNPTSLSQMYGNVNPFAGQRPEYLYPANAQNAPPPDHPAYMPNSYAMSNTGNHGQSIYPRYNVPMSSNPFMMYAPPLIHPPKDAVYPELRALLAPATLQPTSPPTPSIPPEVPFAGSYDSEDDSYTVADNLPHPRIQSQRSGIRERSASTVDGNPEASIMLDVDSTHLEHFRFGVRVPLHFYAPTPTRKWPQSSGTDPGIERHNFDRYEAREVKRLRRGDGGQSIELQCRHGPSLAVGTSEYQMQWLNIQSDNMTLAVFEEFCLSAPDLTPELQYVIARLFEKIEKTHRQRYFDGYLLTPGAVIRCDGATSKYNNTQNLTATFMCFPYMSLRPHGTSLRNDQDGYPSRSVLQTLYPYDSTSRQDMPPSFSKIAPSAADCVILVSQVWCLTIGSKYVITYSPLTTLELRGEDVLLTQYALTPDQIPRSWHPGARESPATSAEDSGRENNVRDPISVDEVLLFDGKRVEDFEVNEFAETHKSKLNKASDWDSGSERIFNKTVVTPTPHRNHAGVRFLLPSALVESAGSLQTQEPHDQTRANVWIQSGDKTSGEVRSLLTMLSSLTEPEMDAEYMELFGTCLTSLLKIWPLTASTNVQRKYEEELKQLQQSIQIAGKMQKALRLEKIRAKIVIDAENRISLIEFLGPETTNRVLEELRSAIKKVKHLFRNSGPKETSASLADPSLHKTSSFDHSNIEKKRELQDIARHSFLAWPWINADVESRDTVSQEAAESLGGNLIRLLQDVDEHIKRRNDTSYSGAIQSTLPELENWLVVSRTSLADVHSQAHRGTDGTKSSQQDANLHENHNEPAPDVTDIESRKKATVAVIETLVQTSKDLVALFIPCDFPHLVLRKIWGSLRSLSQMMIETLELDVGSSQHLCVVRQPSSPSGSHEIPIPPAVALEHCVSCRAGQVYGSTAEAVAHLRIVHFRHQRRSVHDEYLRAHWVQNANQIRSDLTNNHHIRLAELYIDYLRMLYSRANKIHERTASRGDGDAGCTLPGGLVDCFETITLFFVQISTITFGTQSEFKLRMTLPMEEMGLQMDDYALTRLGDLGKAAQQAMTRAEKALVLSDPAATVEIGPAGPGSLLIVLLQNVQKRALLQGENQRNYALYHEYASGLDYSISQFPRRRLLRDIHILQEELSVARMVNGWQQQCLDRLISALDPASFFKAQTDRITMYPAERATLKQTLDRLDIESGELEALEDRTRYLSNQLRQSVEILEEDHGKAIFVFTMVTTIFLPLSFVSSFFGMNFADIRDMEKRQGVFWAIALPVTAGIIVIAVFLANHGDKVLEAVIQFLQRMRRQGQESPKTAASVDGQSVWNSSATTLLQTRKPRQRKSLITK